ncbi:hypothetical protein [Streptomyces cacaoi]|uniref:hypothetical protein n=1 Tax=Streptomyces cacaoi TaxID=1898 RepID=UPI00374A0BA7
MSSTDPGLDPSGTTSGDNESTTLRGKIKRVATRGGITLALAATLAGVTGYTAKDVVAAVSSIGEVEFKAAFESPAPTDGPAIVKRCTRVTIKTTGDLPQGYELWLGTNLKGRKAIVEPLEETGDHTYKGQITIGREQDKSQERQLVVLLVQPSSVSYLRNVRDRISLYDMPSSYWLTGATVATQMEVKRDADSTQKC